jgi:TetR/AcrR family transcriptional regulator, transcriptional repressor for nem operon
MIQTNPRPGQSRGQETRSDILKVARRLISQHGYHSTGIADIQVATGLTKGAFYHHFRSKEDLALAILDQTRTEYAEQLIGPALERPSPAERLEALLDGAASLNSQPEWCNCQMMATLGAELTASDARLREGVQGIYQELFGVCADLLAQAQAAGDANDRIDPETGAQWIATTLTGLCVAKKLGATRVSAGRLIDAMKQTLLEKPSRPEPPATGAGTGKR